MRMQDRQPRLSRRLATAARWPLGVALTSWRYMWRTTPMRRIEEPGSAEADSPPAVPERVSREELQPPEDGVGPLFHRRYRVRIADPRVRAEQLMSELTADLNQASPSEFARFEKVYGREDRLEVDDEFVVRMPGPWDGPVRVLSVTPTSFRFGTLRGHLEAGQIDFSAAQEAGLVFTIESWARSGDNLANLLFERLRMAKEVQLHMWTSFLERVIDLSGGSRADRIEILTRRVTYGR
jgi:uncharacterized protein DUF1990